MTTTGERTMIGWARDERGRDVRLFEGGVPDAGYWMVDRGPSPEGLWDVWTFPRGSQGDAFLAYRAACGERFTVQTVERIVPGDEDEPTDTVDEPGNVGPVDLRGALDALESGCWDSVDDRDDGTVIAYAADAHVDYRTGDATRTDIIVTGSPRDVRRLVALYAARCRREGGRAPYGL